MGNTNFHLSYSEDTVRASGHCASCGANAEVHLALLEEMPQRSGSFCLSCCEALLHNIQHQYVLFGHTNTHGADKTHGIHSMHHEDGEHGIIHWEEHGWSSDGPFAGA
ncbi:MAG TPA: hypothetical protein VGD98_16540 [Ktedonobacteraceae bacterium]